MRNEWRPSSTAGKGGTIVLLFLVLTLASAAGCWILTVKIAEGEREFSEGQIALDEARPDLEEGIIELEAGKQALTEGKETYAAAEDRWHLVWADRLFRGGRGFVEARERIAQADLDIAEGEVRIDAGEARMATGELKLRRGRKQLNLARTLRFVAAGGTICFGALSMLLGFRWRRIAA